MTKTAKIKKSKWDRIDCREDEAELTMNGVVVAWIRKTHGDPDGALSSVDSRGRVAHYEVELDVEDMTTKTFEVGRDENAREVLKSALAWAAERMG